MVRSYGKKNFPHIALGMAISLLLSGCAGNFPYMGSESGRQGESALVTETLGLEPDFSYERKVERPNVQVDSLGYLPKSIKTAVFCGKELPERFQVIEKDSGTVVYEGEIRSGEETSDGILTGYGSFTELEKEGNYYIKCDKIGCSYYFSVGKEVYLEKAKEFAGIMEEAENPDATDVCEAVSYLLVASEMYPELLAEIWGNEKQESEEREAAGEAFFLMLRRKTDWLLSMQDERTGGIYRTAEAFPTDEEGEEEEREISEEATAAFAGTMAKYSYLYQQYDWDYANTCLKAAAKAWKYLNSVQSGHLQDGRSAGGTAPLENNLPGGRFYAASELYRASNESVYHNYILQNKEQFLNQEEDFYLLVGKVTYLSTRRKVNRELCGQIMEGLMKEAENITEGAKNGAFFVNEERTDVILWDMTVLALVNYAIMNREYVTVIEDHVHYLMGRNERAEILPITPESREAAGILLLFSVIEAERKIIETSENKE